MENQNEPSNSGNINNNYSAQSNLSQDNSTQGNPTQDNSAQGNPTQGNQYQGNPTQGNPAQGNQYQGNPAPSYSASSGYSGYNYSYNPNKKKMKPWIIILIIVAVLAFVIWGSVACSNMLNSTPSTNTNTFSSPGKDYLAQITIAGEIGSSSSQFESSDTSYHHKWTLRMLDEIIKDSHNKGLILFVNTPGGGVYESDELYFKIMEYKEKTSNPVYVYMGSMAASGGYYVSAPANKIYANRNTWTGSIGVIVGTIIDVSGFLEKYGIEATNITSGPNKSMGSNFESMTDEQRKIFQSMVDEAYNQFVGIVAEGRGMTVEEVKKIADGRIMTASQAKEAGLIDEIMNRDEFNNAVKEEIGNNEILIQDIRFDGQRSIFLDIMGVFGFEDTPDVAGGSTAESDYNLSGGDAAAVAKILEEAKQTGKIPIKYMCEF